MTRKDWYGKGRIGDLNFRASFKYENCSPFLICPALNFNTEDHVHSRNVARNKLSDNAMEIEIVFLCRYTVDWWGTQLFNKWTNL
jgi:hypothetical protein